jgi:hypothetical protein
MSYKQQISTGFNKHWKLVRVGDPPQGTPLDSTSQNAAGIETY